MRLIFAAFLGFFCVSILSPARSASAQGDINDVPAGATSNEVIALLGEPQEQVERETKRQQVWVYADGMIVFINGRARSLYVKGSRTDRFAAAQEEKLAAQKSGTQPLAASPAEDILSEILREVPSETGSEGVPGGDMRPLEMQR